MPSRVMGPATLEGNDFVAAGPGLCFVGTGARTSEDAVHQLMSARLFGTQRVAMVRDIFDRT
jgi:arginine deiminase